jgi:hypothetical protein
MAHTFSDANGYLDLGPNINGLRQIKKLRSTANGKFPAIDQLLELGYTNLLAELADDCRRLSKQTSDKDIQFSLKHLAVLCRKAEEIIILEM